MSSNNEELTPMIPYIAFESAQARAERTSKRLCILNIILIFALIVSNALWLYRESQLEDVVITQEVDATADDYSDLNLNTIGGDYYGGESED